MLKKWRKSKSFTLAQAAAYLGLTSASQVFHIERGRAFPSPETIARIEAATGGAVTVAHHWRAWMAAHPAKTVEFRVAGRAAARSFLKAAPKRRD